MPCRRYPQTSAPCQVHLRKVAVLTAIACGVCGLRTGTHHSSGTQRRATASTRTCVRSCYKRSWREYPSTSISTRYLQHQSRQKQDGCRTMRDDALEEVSKGAAIAKADTQPWLGNGPDPLAEARSLDAKMTSMGDGKSLQEGQAHEVWMNGPFQAPVQQGPVDVIFLDDDIVVMNKPSGLLCVPGRLEKDSLATRIALELGHYRVDKMVVHRLDMATSGVVIMARSDAALKSLHRQFRERSVRKAYVAMVHGVLPAEEGEVDLPLCRNTGCPPLHMVNFESGKPSLTQWRVVGRAADRTRVELIPVSGRSHQLRLHMDAIGHPILGDHFYGTKESLALANRCLLHAQRLSIVHPVTGEPLMFNADCEF